MRILKLKFDNDVYEALAEAARAAYRPIEMEAEFRLRRSLPVEREPRVEPNQSEEERRAGE